MATQGKLNELWSEHGLKFLRYSGVSVFNVVLGQSLLLFFYKIVGFEAVTSNLLAVAIGTLPSYFLARKYVWAKSGKHSLTREVLPFWGLNVLGTILSTLAVHLADRLSDGNFIAVNAGSIFAWGIVWVVKYLLLDKAIFKAQQREATAPVTVL